MPNYTSNRMITRLERERSITSKDMQQEVGFHLRKIGESGYLKKWVVNDCAIIVLPQHPNVVFQIFFIIVFNKEIL